jgi:integrase
MGLMKDRHGTYYARVKVPERLQAAVARVLDQGKDRQTFLKKSLGTKDLKAANVRAKPILAGFDRVFGEAEQLLAARPMRESLSAAEIKRMSEIYYAGMLDGDETTRREGTGSEPLFQSIAAQLRAAGIEPKTPFSIGALPEAGLSAREVYKRAEQLSWELPVVADALARGNTAIIREELDALLDTYQINLDPKCDAYRRLAMAVLSAHVKALRGIERRNGGEPVDTPPIPEVLGEPGAAGGSLRDAFAGWDKERSRPEDTVSEYKRAVEMFIQLHGDLPVAALKKSHARLYREALQEVPRRRSGDLLKASLPELSAWGRKHPDVPRVSAGTVNKQLGAVQAIAVWGYANGVIPEDAAWADPFAKMRLQGEESERTSFESPDLQRLFAAPVFTQHEYPEGGRGPAAYWLPLLTMFNGARQAELAGLTVADVQQEPVTSTPLLYITAQASRGKKLKTKSSRRVVPIHAQLVRLGFLKFVEDVRKRDGEKAFLFPLLAVDKGRAGVKAYSKWFGRYLRAQGVIDTAKVFHSFRHGFKDALRQGKVSQEISGSCEGAESRPYYVIGSGKNGHVIECVPEKVHLRRIWPLSCRAAEIRSDLSSSTALYWLNLESVSREFQKRGPVNHGTRCAHVRQRRCCFVRHDLR